MQVVRITEDSTIPNLAPWDQYYDLNSHYWVMLEWVYPLWEYAPDLDAFDDRNMRDWFRQKFGRGLFIRTDDMSQVTFHIKDNAHFYLGFGDPND